MEEEWRFLFGEELYEVSSLGNVRSHIRYGARIDQSAAAVLRDAPLLLNPYMDTHGYLCASVGPANKRKQPARIHTLVVRAFHGDKPFPKAECRHLNGIKTDNRAVNLRWGTRKENMEDRVRLGEAAHGENHPKHVFTETEVVRIRELYATGLYSYEHLSMMFHNVHVRSIGDLVHGYSWARVGGPRSPKSNRMGSRKEKNENLLRYLESTFEKDDKATSDSSHQIFDK